MSELEWLDATALADLVRRGEVTPSELVEDAIARIEARNPSLNAVIIPLFEKARAAAAGTLPDGPFRGVPFLLKDCVAHSAGDPYHCGMQVLKDAGYVAPTDTELVRRYRAAGFVIVGKTNLPELASSPTTEPLAYGATHNPWDPDRSPGGSSGGAGAAVAAGMVAVAHGNDMGGSIRIPASACGLVGLKPTRARNSLGPHFGEYWGPTTHEHVLTRSVRDTAAVLDATAGPAPGDPYSAPAPARPFLEEVGADPGRLRIGFRVRRTGAADDVHPDCVAAVLAALPVLESLGHVVEPVDLPALDDPAFGAALGGMFGPFMARDLDRWSAALGRTISPSELEPWNAQMVEFGRSVTAPQYVEALERANDYSRGLARFWTGDADSPGYDLLVTPQLGTPPPRLGELAPTCDLADLGAAMGTFTPFTTPFNLTGQPAISLPLHWNEDGLPIGVQLVAAYGRDDLLLRVAAQLEQAMPWAGRHPPALTG
ncbi:MAG: amidase [Actinobacteria bacterium]|nr:amidase [Actinomycetota bacterium]